MHWSGRAVRPQCQPYRVDGDVVVTISPQIRIDAYEPVTASRTHAIAHARRILLMATLSNGMPVPAGLAVFDARRREIARVADGGVIVLANADSVTPLGVRLPGGAIGLLHFALPPVRDATLHYERIPALCTPVHRSRAPR